MKQYKAGEFMEWCISKENVLSKDLSAQRVWSGLGARISMNSKILRFEAENS